MKTKGKFILFENINEFKEWLFAKKITRKIKLIQQHHCWKPSYSDFNGKNHFELVAGMEKYQMGKPNHFFQIAQTFTIFPDGTIMLCRDINIVPAGIKGANSNGICVENVGNFDVGKDVMTETHKKTIIKVNALLLKKFNLIASDQSIVYHHWYDLNTGKRINGTGVVKTCPGTNYFNGNSVDAANKNFISLIKEEMKVT
jgi:hypothetical protein